MRSDYPNSDLINKVNSEWFDKVLVHPELCHDDAVDDDSDFSPRDDLSRGEAPPMPREPVQVLAHLRKLRHPDPDMADWSTTRTSRPRSIARRVSERLALAVAALGFGAAAWMAPGAQEATDPVSLSETNAPPERAAQTDATPRKLVEPSWFAPEILYATAIAPSSTRHAETPPPVTRPGR
jgi:hypothetical protein